jgi:hypothetical protein
MSLFLRHIARYAVQKLASDPAVRERAAEAVRAATSEAKQIARGKDKARNAGRALRRAVKKLQGDQ